MSRLSIRIRLKFPVIVIEAFWVIPDIYIRGAMHLSVGRARRAVIVRHAGKSVYSPISVPVRNHGVVENPQPCRVCNLFAHTESFNKTQTRNSHQLRLSRNTIHASRATSHDSPTGFFAMETKFRFRLVFFGCHCRKYLKYGLKLLVIFAFHRFNLAP